MIRRAALPLLVAVAAACSSDPAPVGPTSDAEAPADVVVAMDLGSPVDVPRVDVPIVDASVDVPRADVPVVDVPVVDVPIVVDAPVVDVPVVDAPVVDVPTDRGAPVDVGVDAGARDAGFDVVDVPVVVDVATDVGRDAGAPDTGPVDAGTPDAGCVSPRRLCGEVCTDTASDSAHCGACGVRCAGVCSRGACTQVAQVAAGTDFTCARLVDGAARCWGNNENGQLGDGTGGTRTGRWRPTPVMGLANAVQIVAGNTHACARLADGTAQCWGRNSSGQLGGGTAGGLGLTPRAVVGLGGVAELSLGENFTCARLNDGTVRCWGTNLSGQMGLGTQTGSVITPTMVPGLSGVVSISSGVAHTCAVLSDGTARCWGMNFQGQSGAGAGVDRALSPVMVQGLSGAVGISLGSFHSCAWRSDGTARCWGDNSGYDLGDGSSTRRDAAVAVLGLDRVASLSSGASFTCARRTDGAVLCWGTNALGQMGDGTLGGAQMTPTVVPGLGAVTEVTARGNHACARRMDASVRCWGSDASGELGDDAGLSGHRTPEAALGLRADVVQVAAGGEHTCARFSDGSAQCWGSGNTGELGDGVTARSRHVPVAVSGLTGAAALAAGSFGTCARMTDGTVRCWGYNSDGQIGDGTEGGTRATPTVALGLSGVTDIGLGQTFACALSGGSVRCWGSNNNGRLGINSAGMYGIPRASTPVMGLSGAAGVGLGLFHACAWTSAGAARCWGANDDGQLGDGTTTARWVSTAVPGTGSVTALVGGYSHTCALRSDGTVACWGRNSAGQVGDGTTTSPRPTAIAVAGLTGVAQLAAGEFHTCARRTDGTVRCWGNNDYGQCGDDSQGGSRPSPVTVRGLAGVAEIAAGTNHTCARMMDGTLRCWGSDRTGQLALGALRTPRW
ncbi:MAG: RCC1 repeat-containing protein [Deltaproteobacteria bacterium]|nr:RCC1 repeat-containing protein [Deltaproteobacteria bacterium]